MGNSKGLFIKIGSRTDTLMLWGLPRSMPGNFCFALFWGKVSLCSTEWHGLNINITCFKLVVILLPQFLSVIITDVNYHTWLQGNILWELNIPMRETTIRYRANTKLCLLGVVTLPATAILRGRLSCHSVAGKTRCQFSKNTWIIGCYFNFNPKKKKKRLWMLYLQYSQSKLII